MLSRKHTYVYQNKSISYIVWYSSVDTVRTIIFLGTIQIDKLPEWVAASCPPGTAVVQGAPHWHGKADGTDTAELIFAFTKSAYANILSGNIASKIDIIAESQAAPGVVRLLFDDHYRQNLRQLILLQPLGCNVYTFGDTETSRIRILQRRTLQNARHQLMELPRDSHLRYNHMMLRKMVDFRDDKVRAQYAAGLSYDMLPELKSLWRSHHQILIISGEHDKVFPANEIRDSLQKASLPIDVTVVPKVPHSPLATRKGQLLLKAAFAHIRKRT